MTACDDGHKDVVQLLLNHCERIELNARDNNGYTAFMRACKLGRKDVVKLLLKYPKVVNINIPKNVWIPEEMRNLIKMHLMTVQK